MWCLAQVHVQVQLLRVTMQGNGDGLLDGNSAAVDVSQPTSGHGASLHADGMILATGLQQLPRRQPWCHITFLFCL